MLHWQQQKQPVHLNIWRCCFWVFITHLLIIVWCSIDIVRDYQLTIRSLIVPKNIAIMVVKGAPSYHGIYKGTGVVYDGRHVLSKTCIVQKLEPELAHHKHQSKTTLKETEHQKSTTSPPCLVNRP